MKSKPIDAGVLPKVWRQVIIPTQSVLATQTTVATLNFNLNKSGVFNIGHYLMAHRDSSTTLQSILRQLYIDSIGLYAGNQFQASVTPYDVALVNAETIRNLAAGPHSIYMTVWCSTANYYAIDEGYINLKEL